jgi:hypothetical protein
MNYSTFYSKNCHQAFKNMGSESGIRDPGSEIRDLGSGKNLFRIPDTDVKKGETLHLCFLQLSLPSLLHSKELKCNIRQMRKAVLRIRDVYPESRIRIKEFKYFNPKNGF